jgi:hypothetical protein
MQQLKYVGFQVSMAVTMKNAACWVWYRKYRFSQNLHGATSQNMAFFLAPEELNPSMTTEFISTMIIKT